MSIKDRFTRLAWFAGWCLLMVIFAYLLRLGYGDEIAIAVATMLVAAIFHFLLFGVFK